MSDQPAYGSPEPRDTTRQELADIQRVTQSGSLLTGWLQRMQVHASTQQVKAQAELIGEVRHLIGELELLDHAKVGRKRAIAYLRDADKVIAADADERRTTMLKAQDAREQAELDLELRRMERERKLKEAREQHARAMEQPLADPPPAATDAPEPGANQAQREFQADLDQELSAEKARLLTEEFIADYIRRNGGEGNLTKEQKENIARIRTKLEQTIRESGFV